MDEEKDRQQLTQQEVSFKRMVSFVFSQDL